MSDELKIADEWVRHVGKRQRQKARRKHVSVAAFEEQCKLFDTAKARIAELERANARLSEEYMRNPQPCGHPGSMNYDLSGFIEGGDKGCWICRAESAERELAELREPGELTDERILEIHRAEALRKWENEDTALVIPTVVRRCLSIYKASHPAPKWVVIPSEEYDELRKKKWRQAGAEWDQSATRFLVLLCPPVPLPEEGK